MQRFNSKTNSKNNSKIFFDEIIHKDTLRNMNCLSNIINNNSDYILKGIIYHIGLFNKGHYYSVINLKGEWFEFNDSNVKKLDDLDLFSNYVCTLFYIKK